MRLVQAGRAGETNRSHRHGPAGPATRRQGL